MSKVRSKETAPEVMVRKFLFSKGFRYRKNSKLLPGKPDIVISRLKIAILIHGCFWHGHKNCKDARLPKSRIEYWKPKIERNSLRDKSNKKILKKLGWKVIDIWTCELKNKIVADKRLKKLLKQINS